MSDDGVRDLLDGGPGKPSWGGLKTMVGESIKGVIVDLKEGVQRDMDGNEKTFADGSVRKQLIITLQTTLNDPEIEDDDGIRRIFAKGGSEPAKNKKGLAMLNALRLAQKAAKAKIVVGGTLEVKLVDVDKPSKVGQNGQKLWEATYWPPTVDLDELNA